MLVDLAARRRDFPALAGREIAYLDSAATTLRPQAVLDAVMRTFTHEAGNPHRSVHRFADAAADAIERARASVARLLCGTPGEIIFTSGTTASINLVAQAWGRANLGPGDVVIASELEHHSNLVPWQMICAERGAELRIAPVDDAGRIELERIDFARAKLVAVAHVSNVTGTIAPIAELARRAHAVGALLLVDGAQAVAHLDVDVTALGCDFYAFSAHKVYGPTGTGVLWGRAAVLDAMPPWQGGGGMIRRVDATSSTYREVPARFEAGTPNVAGIAGLDAALAYMDTFAARGDEARAHAALIRAIRDAGGRVLGEPELAVVSFELPRVHPHDVATLADGDGVALRSGHHCAAPLHRRFGVEASTRASVGCYTNDGDIEMFRRTLARIREIFP
ncbi:MAG TPA: aminotransferase class V-fold PLP-dependent enzyme [Kofleriaceae bacterium]|jgi:cysteine desulfurase/selenocysteine lyase|nr:aminotransferase class V-fold PLP-dependent enzyme [Kofleriaceae bacterium]